MTDHDLFAVPQDVIYLNTASIGPRLKAVEEAGKAGLSRYSAPWKLTTQHWLGDPDALRQALADLIGVSADTIALIPSVSYGIAVAAKNLPFDRGQRILVTAEQFPSNIYAWRRLAEERGGAINVAAKSADCPLSEALLDLIGPDTGIVAVPNCHWTDGEWIDLAAISDAARTVGAALVVDASQSLGAVPLDFGRIQPDYVISAGYKWLLGAYGLAYLYAAPRHAASGVPLEESWINRRGSEDRAALADYQDAYRSGARRFDVGESSQFIHVPMALAGIAQLAAWGETYVTVELKRRTDYLRQALSDLGLSILPEDRSSVHLMGVELPADVDPRRIAQGLKERHIFLSVRGTKLRIAPHLHNREQDLAHFIAAITELL